MMGGRREEGIDAMVKLLEIETERRVRREEAAGLLRELAESLERHNVIEFEREGVRYTIDVPDHVTLQVEIEVGDESELEVELHW
jgi:amphi-Trp domain-containing protein